MRTTIRDIAQATGLSITTVSLVLNNKGNRISIEHRQLIKEIAKKLNYRPNRLAVGLLKKKTNTIGLIIPDISNSFFSEMTKGIEDTGRQAGYNLILCNSNDQQDLEIEYINTLVDNGVDGMIITMSAESYGDKAEKSFAALWEAGTPSVIVDCFSNVKDFSTVTVDNIKGSYLAVEYLFALGHRRIACISGPIGPKTNDDRLTGYVNGLKKHNISYDEHLVFEGDFRFQSGYDAISKLLPYHPTAILCLNDMMAYGASKALREQGIKIPDKMSVMGFDDIFFSKLMEVPLTTIEQPVYKMGEDAANILIDEISGNKKRSHILLDPKLKIRNSTKKNDLSQI